MGVGKVKGEMTSYLQGVASLREEKPSGSEQEERKGESEVRRR